VFILCLIFLISSVKQLWMNLIAFAEILYYNRSRSLHDAARAFVNINNVSKVDKTMIKGGGYLRTEERW